MVDDFYVVKINEKIIPSNESSKGYADLMHYMNEIPVNSAILYFKDYVLYFERTENVSVLVSAKRGSVGLAKLRAKKLIETYEKNVKLKSLDDAFKLAEKLENMNLEDFIKFKEGKK